jgi:type III secretion protein N (ATPase)
VVGLDGAEALLAPYGSVAGLSIRTEVVGLGSSASILVGRHLLGAVVDASGQPLPGLDPLPPPGPDAERRTLQAEPPEPLLRQPIDEPFVFGIRCIDGFLTTGIGQRIGIFGAAGGGKSTLVSMCVSQADADVVVVGLIGERGREVGDFLRKTLTPQTRRRTIIVVATSDRPPVERMQAAFVATTIAEFFRDQGQRVLLIVDSVTRLARALREIGLSAGEPPTRRGFPPSVFAMLPLVFERAGPGERGTITAIYTVLVEGEASADPVAEETRSLLDGHIVLSDKLAAAGHYPAIDILESRSRLMDSVTEREHRAAANRLRELVAKHREIELLVQVGEYRPGQDAVADEALARIDAINAFLKQGAAEPTPFGRTVQALRELTA